MTVDRRRAAQRSPAVWRAADFADPAEWTIELTDDERDEIVAATERAVAAGRTIDDLGVDDFPLPDACGTSRRRGRAAQRRARVPAAARLPHRPSRSRRGRARVRRARAPSRHARRPGRARHAARPRPRRRRGPHRSRAFASTARDARQDFHTDGADLVGLLCLQRAESGGESRIASSAAVYNEMLAPPTRPGRRALRAVLLGPQRRAVAKARIRSSRCPSSAT